MLGSNLGSKKEPTGCVVRKKLKTLISSTSLYASFLGLLSSFALTLLWAARKKIEDHGLQYHLVETQNKAFDLDWLLTVRTESTTLKVLGNYYCRLAPLFSAESTFKHRPAAT